MKAKGAATLVLCGVLLAASAHSQQDSKPPDPLSLTKRAIFVGDTAYVALPADPVSGPNVFRNLSLSPNGAYLLMVQMTPTDGKTLSFESKNTSPKRAKVELTLWNTAERKGATIWRGVLTETQFSPASDITWLPSTSVALVQTLTGQIQTADKPESQPDVVTQQSSLLLVDAAKGTSRTVAALTPSRNPMYTESLIVCPGEAKAAIVSPKGDAVRVISANGSIGRTFATDISNGAWMGWRDDNRTLYGIIPPPPVPKDVAPNTPRPWKHALLDTRTGDVTIHDGKPDPRWRRSPNPAQFTPPPLAVTSGKGAIQQETTTEDLKPLWLSGVGKDTEGRALLTPDGGKAVILPDAVVYEAQGTLFAAPLVAMNRQAFVEGRRKAYQTATVQRAKQIGLALVMYAQDYDNVLPPPGSDVETFLPYLRNRDTVANPETGKLGLQLVYRQSAISSYQTPAQDVLGYLSGPGGRAIIYVDGHVKWEDRP